MPKNKTTLPKLLTIRQAAEILPNLKTQSGKFAKWQLKDYSREKFEELLKKVSNI